MPRTQPTRGGLAQVARLRGQAARTALRRTRRLHPERREPRSPPPTLGPAAESSGSHHGVRPPRAPQSRTPARPTCASARPGPGPGLRQPDAAAAGLTLSPRLRRTRSSGLGGGAQRSPRNPFVWLNRRDITRRPNRRLPGGGACVRRRPLPAAASAVGRGGSCRDKRLRTPEQWGLESLSVTAQQGP